MGTKTPNSVNNFLPLSNSEQSWSSFSQLEIHVTQRDKTPNSALVQRGLGLTNNVLVNIVIRVSVAKV